MLMPEMMLMPEILGPLLGAMALCLAHATWRASRRRRQARAGYFAALSPLFDRMTLRIQPDGFARATGHSGKDVFDLQAIPDALTYRKLPALWVMVTLPGPMPVRAMLSLMARPSGQETFSRFATLPQALPRLAALPEHVAAHCDMPNGVPSPDLIARHAALFDDPRVKELVISPQGLRLVILAEEADRGRFLLYRDAETGMAPVSARRVTPLLAALRALREDLMAPANLAPQDARRQAA